MLRLTVISATIASMITSATFASPFLLVVDPAQSNVTVELCMNFGGTGCDSDMSPVVGWAVVSLNCLTAPAGLTLYDFDYLLTETIDLHLDFGWLFGTFDGTGTGVELLYAFPGYPMPETPVGPGGSFVYPGVPTVAEGQLSYSATMAVCLALQLAGYACQDTIDLSTMDMGPLDMQDGTIGISGRDVTVALNIDVAAPLDPNNPDLGAIHVTGGLVAHGSVPPPAVPIFLGVLLGEITDLDLVCESDMDGDGTVNGMDIQPYVSALLAL